MDAPTGLTGLTGNKPESPEATPEATPETPPFDDVFNSLKTDLTRTFESFLQVSTGDARVVANNILEKGEKLLAEHAGSKNFDELAKHVASQTANEFAQLGLRLNAEARLQAASIVRTLLGTARIFITRL